MERLEGRVSVMIKFSTDLNEIRFFGVELACSLSLAGMTEQVFVTGVFGLSRSKAAATCVVQGEE